MNIKVDRFLLLFLILPMYGLRAQSNSGQIPEIDFCDLSKYEGKTVKITCSYSGVDAYWGLGSLPNKKCKQDLSIELNVNKDHLSKKYQKDFAKVHEKYWLYYMILKMTGRFENGTKSGDNRLSSNSSRFIADEIEDIQLLERITK